MKARRHLTVVGPILAIGLTACAGTPPAPASAPTTPTAQATDTAKGKPESPFPGYYPYKTRNGQVLYCREDEAAGSRIRKQICATEDTLRNQTAESRKQIDDIRQTAGTGGCNPAAGC